MKTWPLRNESGTLFAFEVRNFLATPRSIGKVLARDPEVLGGGFGLGGGFSAYFGFDSNGRIGGGVTFQGGAMVGAGLSATGDFSISNADSMGQLAGPGLTIGASVGEGIVGGIDAFFGGHPSTSDDYMGLSGHLGVGVGTPVEIHAMPSYTCGN